MFGKITFRILMFGMILCRIIKNVWKKDIQNSNGWSDAILISNIWKDDFRNLNAWKDDINLKCKCLKGCHSQFKSLKR